MAFIDCRDTSSGVRELGLIERAQAISVGEAWRLAKERELQHLDQVVLDEHTGGLAGGVLDDLHARRWHGVTRDAGPRQRAAVGDRVDRRLVPVAPDAADVDRMIRRPDVEVDSRRPAVLREPARRVLVERRRSNGHGDHPVPLRSPGGVAANELLDVADRAAPSQRRVLRLQSLAIEVGVGVDQPGNDGGAAKIDDLGTAATPGLDVATIADGRNPPAGDGQRGCPRASLVEGEDRAVGEYPVGVSPGALGAHLPRISRCRCRPKSVLSWKPRNSSAPGPTAPTATGSGVWPEVPQ